MVRVLVAWHQCEVAVGVSDVRFYPTWLGWRGGEPQELCSWSGGASAWVMVAVAAVVGMEPELWFGSCKQSKRGC